MNRWTRYTIAFVMILCWSATALAWLRPLYEDAIVIDRSEAILIGRLEKDSIKYVPHVNQGGGNSWEYHATLLVSETLKGPLNDKKVAIVINYGLDPLIGGLRVKPDQGPSPGPAPAGIPLDRIDIVDTGGRGGTVLENAQKDNVWFLRHLGGELGREAGKGPWGIVDPEDVQPLKFKDYFKSLLSADAEKKIDLLLSDSDEAVSLRTLRYLSVRHRPGDAHRIAGLLKASNKKVQTAAAELLAQLADFSAVIMFRQALESPNAGVRLAACNFLCRFRDTTSIAAINNLLPGFDSVQRAEVIANLPRMESRKVVDILLDHLDEHLDPTANPMSAYRASVQAANALRALTGIEFPLDADKARHRWDELKILSDALLLRKRIVEDIEALTDPRDFDTRWSAYAELGRLANQHFGSYDAFHGGADAVGRAESQRLWRQWAKENITRPRIDWTYDGFARSGIVLPRPMDEKGTEKLLAVLQYYANPSRRAQETPGWSVDGGWVKATFHCYNANWLLERFTSQRMGLSPHYLDLNASLDTNVLSDRWAAWWKENRNRIEIHAPPYEEAVTAEMLSRAPSLRLPPPPLVLRIRPPKEAHRFKGWEPLTIGVEVKNVSKQDVLIARRPLDVRYHSSNASGSRGMGERGGRDKEDFVVLKPGESITWDQADTPSVDDYVEPPKVEGLQYELTYYSAGSQFGLHAWRGRLVSNEINVEIETEE